MLSKVYENNNLEVWDNNNNELFIKTKSAYTSVELRIQGFTSTGEMRLIDQSGSIFVTHIINGFLAFLLKRG